MGLIEDAMAHLRRFRPDGVPPPPSDDIIERLLAVVERLPRTADGVPVVPGMNLYSRRVDYDFGCIAIRVEPESDEIECRDVRGVEFDLPARECYSTRAAAEAAREVKP